MNGHVVNVFAKKLQILEGDQSKQELTADSAEFVLYRKATAAERTDSTVTKNVYERTSVW